MRRERRKPKPIDYEDKLKIFKKWKETNDSNLGSVLTDLHAMLDDWESEKSYYLRLEHYKDWDRTDFEALLIALDDRHLSQSERSRQILTLQTQAEKIEVAKIQRKNIDRQQRIDELEKIINELTYKLILLKQDHPNEMSLEKELDLIQKNLGLHQQQLEGIGWLARRFSKRNQVKILEENIRNEKQRIDELILKIQQNPLEERKKAEEVRQIKKTEEVNECQQRLDQTVEELRKVRTPG